jgi:ElaB/YqjD/DUF883 family membrane-anchored ribosome-binding protein
MTLGTKEPLNRTAAVRERTEDTMRRAAREARILKSMAADAIDDGVHAVKRSVKKARVRAIDGRDELIYRVKRQPLPAIAVAFGVGALLGLLAGFAGGRARSARD